MRLTSPMIAPPLARIGSTSSGLSESNTSQIVSPRRNEAAGVALGNEKVRRRPSLSRQASTLAASAGPLASGLVSAGREVAGAAVIFFDGSAIGASAFGLSAFGASLGASAFGVWLGASILGASILAASGFGASILGTSALAGVVSFCGASEVDGAGSALTCC